MDLQSLVEETAQDTKILDAIVVLETGKFENISYPYRPHGEYLETRFGLLFYNEKLVIPEALRSTRIAMLHQGHVSINEMDQSAEASEGPAYTAKSEKKQKIAPTAEPQVKT